MTKATDGDKSAKNDSGFEEWELAE